MEDAIPVTTLARTLLDLAEVLPISDLARAIDAAERLRLFDLRSVEELICRSRGRAGIGALRDSLRSYRPLPAAARSELERRFHILCREAGIPPPAVNVQVAGLEVDAVWHDARLIVELDGRTYHDTRAAFEEDRMRDATLQLAGYRVLRLTYRRMESEPAAAVQTVRMLLGAAPH